MRGQMTPRYRRFAECASLRLAAEGVDTSDHDAVRACLLRRMSGRLLWRAWLMRDNAAKWAPRQLSLDDQPRVEPL